MRNVTVLLGVTFASLAFADATRAEPGFALPTGSSSFGLFAPTSSSTSTDDSADAPAPTPAPPATATPAKERAPTKKSKFDAALIRAVTDGVGAHITSDFGARVDPMGDRWSRHSGIDIAAPLGSSIFALSAGVVTIATYDSGCGFMVEIKHKSGLATRYCHAAALLVEEGESVDKGQRIAIVGATGEATGAHVHVELRAKGRAINPRTLLR